MPSSFRRLVVFFLLATTPLSAAQPQLFRVEGTRDFLDGEVEGLSADSGGRLRLAPVTSALHDPEVPYVWSLVRDGRGASYAGTGNDGKVFRIAEGRAEVYFDAAEMEVHALALGRDGTLYVGTSPDGKVYAVTGKDKSKELFDPQEKYIWALAIDDEGRILVATGAEGHLYRVTKDGTSTALFKTSETHITALGAGPAGSILFGTAPGGVVYRTDAAGKTSVLYDTAFREVKAVAAGPQGAVYAAVVEAQDKEETVRPLPPPPAPSTAAAGTAEVTVTETVVAVVAPPAMPSRAMEPVRSGSAKGALLRLATNGDVETLWSSNDEMPHSLLPTSEGILLGTGNKGKIYRVADDQSWTMVTGVGVEQVTAFAAGNGQEVLFATSNPGKVYSLGGGYASSGSFVSKVKDTETISTWGRVAWRAEAPAGSRVEVRTRTGNTGTPDTTWSPWSEPHGNAAGEAITSAGARFVQLKVSLHGKADVSPVLSSVSAAYLQRNLRPQVTSVTTHPPGEVFQKPLSVSGEVEILGLDPAENAERVAASTSVRALIPTTSYSRKLQQRGLQTVSWKADDPNNDTLTFDVEYRAVGETRRQRLREGLTESVLAWDTSTIPNGRYVVRITASDAAGNPQGLALTGYKESDAFDVDNTPPVVTVSTAGDRRVRAVIRDADSPVRKAERSIDGGKWSDVYPADGINDSPEESYEITVPDGSRLVVVRGTDALGNVSTGRVELK